MPLPVFIICSEGGSIDRHTNQLSIFDVIEKITFRPVLPAQDGSRQVEVDAGSRPLAFNSLRMTALWRQLEGDAGREFDFKTTVLVPGSANEIMAGQGRIVFKTPLHRIVANYIGDFPQQSGDIVVRTSIKPVESNDWITQEYVIPVERLDDANQKNLALS